MALLASMWVGKELGEIEVLCAKSLIAHGDKLIIYGYEFIENIPMGVEFRDANEILPSPIILKHKKTGSPALHADLFRYALINKTEAIWVDLDVLALKPFEFQSEWVFAYEKNGCVNGAVLRFPKESQTLGKLLEMNAGTRGMPPNLVGIKKIKYAMRNFISGGLHISEWPWGSTWPGAITQFLYETDEIKHTLPKESFYAISLEDVEKFLQPHALSLKDVPKDAWALHLWGKQLRNVLKEKYGNQIPDGSFLKNYV